MLPREIITSALNELKVYAPGEDVSTVDLARGFQSLNVMIESWSNESLTCFTILEQSLTLRVGVAAYTIGPGGDIDTDTTTGQRPLKLIEGRGAAYIQDSNSNNYLVDVITKAEWNMIGNRVVTTSDFPDTLYYSPNFPLGQLNVFPVPNQANTLFFDSYQQLTRFPSIDLDITLPPGYSKALQHNLAIDLEPMYPTAKLSQNTMTLAREAKGNVKRTNSRIILAQYDSELTARAPGSYNIFTDSYNSPGR